MILIIVAIIPKVIKGTITTYQSNLLQIAIS